jgi:hypothetical protein
MMVHSRVRCFQSLPAPSPAIEADHCHCKPVPSRNGDMGHVTMICRPPRPIGEEVRACPLLHAGGGIEVATHDNAELLALSGPRNPYPGKLGVVEEDALADLLLVDGDPIANIKLLEDPGKNLVVIMKDGRVYKNTL